MARRRFFVEEVHHGKAEVSGDSAHHLRNVLRVEAGQKYEICDGGRVYLAQVELSTKKRVRFQVLEELPAVLPPVRVYLYVALVKFDRLELIVEKATELGVERIAPVIASRSEKGLEKAADKRRQRWRKIAVEASQQSRRVRLPELAPLAKFREAVRAEADHRYFLEEAAGAAPFLTQLPEAGRRGPADVVTLLAGPEGGWTEAERMAAAEREWRSVSLGPQILRTETAAIAAAALVMAAWSAAAATPR